MKSLVISVYPYILQQKLNSVNRFLLASLFVLSINFQETLIHILMFACLCVHLLQCNVFCLL